MFSDPTTPRSARIYKGFTGLRCKIAPIFRDPHGFTGPGPLVCPPLSGTRSIARRGGTIVGDFFKRPKYLSKLIKTYQIFTRWFQVLPNLIGNRKSKLPGWTD